MTNEAIRDISDSMNALALLLVCLCITGLQNGHATRDMKNTEENVHNAGNDQEWCYT